MGIYGSPRKVWWPEGAPTDSSARRLDNVSAVDRRVSMERKHWKELGDHIRARRLELGHTIESIADDTKIRRKFLESLENGECDDLPPGDLRDRLATQYLRALGLSREDIAHWVRPRCADDLDRQILATMVEQRHGAMPSRTERLLAVLGRIALAARHSPDGTKGPHPAVVPVLAIAFLLGAGLRYSMDSKPVPSSGSQKKSRIRQRRASQPEDNGQRAPEVGTESRTLARSIEQTDRASLDSVSSVAETGTNPSDVVTCGPEHAVECLSETKMRPAIPSPGKLLVRSMAPRARLAVIDRIASRIRPGKQRGIGASPHPASPKRLAVVSTRPPTSQPINLEVTDLTNTATAQGLIPGPVELLAHSSAFQPSVPSPVPFSAAPVSASGPSEREAPPQVIVSKSNRSDPQRNPVTCCGPGAVPSRPVDELQSLTILRRRLGTPQ
jgi:Helix-turn-helix domain